jgi:hypothetical protein
VRAQARNAAGLSAPVDAAKVRVVEAGGATWYEVNFVTGFGPATGSMPPQQASTPTPLRANTWNPPGKEFIGWAITTYAAVSGSKNVVYADKAIYSFDSDVWLEAVWRNQTTVSVPGTPPAPTAVAGTAKVTATVSPGTSGDTPTSYTVTAYTVNDTAAGTCTVTGASGSCDVTALTAGSTYTVKAIAKNTAGDSGASGASSPVTVPATVPGAPGLTALSRRSKTEVWVTFSAPSSTGGKPITGYTVTATRNGVDVTQSFPAEAGRVSVGPLTRYAVYTFTVRAVNSVGTSNSSNASSFRVG